MKYHFRINKEDSLYWGECIEIASCHSRGDTLIELKEMLKECLDLVLDEPPESEVIFPLPDPSIKPSDDVIDIEMEPHIAFSQLLRQYRISRRMSLSDAQKALGLPNRNSYVRLEKKGNPTFQMVEKVMKAFPDFPIASCF